MCGVAYLPQGQYLPAPDDNQLMSIHADSFWAFEWFGANPTWEIQSSVTSNGAEVVKRRRTENPTRRHTRSYPNKTKNVKIKTCGKTILRLPSISRRPAFSFFFFLLRKNKYDCMVCVTAVKLSQRVSSELHDNEKAKCQHLVFPANI